MRQLDEQELVVLETTRLVLEAVLSSSKQVDQAGVWLLAGYGIMGSFLVGNLESLTRIVGPQRVRATILVLILGGLFGLLQKVQALRVGVLLGIDGIIRRSGGEFSVEKEGSSTEWEVDVNSISAIRNRIAELVPAWDRSRILRNLEGQMMDPMFLYRGAVSAYSRQRLYILAEVLFFLLTVAILGLSVRPV